jgi:cytoskeletal protein CcmA (bactofilin family)
LCVTEVAVLWHRKVRTLATHIHGFQLIRFLVGTRRVSPASNERATLPTENTDSEASEPRETVLGRSAIVRGELSVNEDLLIDGEFEGSLRAQGHRIIVGPHAKVKSDIHAGEAMVRGRVEGNIFARAKIEIRKTAYVVGELNAPGIVIETGAQFKGNLHITREEEKETVRARNAVAASGLGSESNSSLEQSACPESDPTVT